MTPVEPCQHNFPRRLVLAQCQQLGARLAVGLQQRQLEAASVDVSAEDGAAAAVASVD